MPQGQPHSTLAHYGSPTSPSLRFYDMVILKSLGVVSQVADRIRMGSCPSMHKLVEGVVTKIMEPFMCVCVNVHVEGENVGHPCSDGDDEHNPFE